MSLYQTVGKFIEKEKLFTFKDTLLCAVSGGIDSMVMTDLLRSMGYQLHVAHVNYMLRDHSSILDQELVVSYCNDHDIPCHIKKLSKDEVSELKKQNFQERARTMRYAWFSELKESHDTDFLCLGHHCGDVAETFLLHSIRGSGMSGLRSIQHTIGNIRRPLLSIGRTEIRAYADDHKIPYRDDASNFSDNYDRNYLRLQVLPILKQKWPHSTQGFAESANLISRDYQLVEDLVRPLRAQWISEEKEILKFGPISEFRKLPSSKNLAYHLLKIYEFHADVVEKMIFEIHQSGKIFESTPFEAIVDRDHLLIKIKSKHSNTNIELSVPGKSACALGQCTSIVTPAIPGRNPGIFIQYIDASLITVPLTIRNWKEGDIITPLGMGGHEKKISDILIDMKVNIFEKRNQLVLCNGDGRIIWLIGKKLSDQFKYNSKTSDYLKLEWTPGL